MTSLLRTKSAGFDIENAVTLTKLEEDGYEKYLINTDFVFKSLPSFNADFDTKTSFKRRKNHCFRARRTIQSV
ncbi:MAG: hypothetical protein L6V93_06375 [Clostridiales bacterium]|nr:MAG: hypothetical protein L6V93_06375 [Clostridiales bacterium]